MEVGINNTCNVTKTVCMAFRPVCKRKDSSCAFPHFQLNGTALCFVDEFKYMGHIINNKPCRGHGMRPTAMTFVERFHINHVASENFPDDLDL